MPLGYYTFYTGLNHVFAPVWLRFLSTLLVEKRQKRNLLGWRCEDRRPLVLRTGNKKLVLRLEGTSSI